MRKMMVSVALALLAGWAFADEPPPIVNGGGMVLKDLVGKDRMVTVVLKNKAMDLNLRVVDIGPVGFSVLPATGERTAYLFSSVAEIRVQDGQVESHEFNLDANRTLRPKEQTIVERVLKRCRELFDTPKIDQSIKMRAATFLSASGEKDSNEYLHKLASSNDLPTEVEASLCLYIAGDNEIGKTVIPQGIKSGDRGVSAKASLLAGLTGDQSVVPVLQIMMRDRAREICAPAARALALLGVRDAIPDLFNLIQLIDSVKGDAAVRALTQLGGSDIVDQAKGLLAHAEGLVRYRLVLLLYRLNDPTGKDLMAKEMFTTPTLQPEAATILARDGNRDAIQYLSGRLQGLYDEKPEVLLFRAKAAIALMYTTDPMAVSHLQKLLAANLPMSKIAICNLIAETGKRKLLPILQPLIEADNKRPWVVMAACGAVLAVAQPDFQARFIATLQD